MLELREAIPVETPLGWGHAIIFESGEHDAHWTVILAETRAFVTFPQSEIRACRNYTRGWGISHEEMQRIIRP